MGFPSSSVHSVSLIWSSCRSAAMSQFTATPVAVGSSVSRVKMPSVTVPRTCSHPEALLTHTCGSRVRAFHVSGINPRYASRFTSTVPSTVAVPRYSSKVSVDSTKLCTSLWVAGQTGWSMRKLPEPFDNDPATLSASVPGSSVDPQPMPPESPKIRKISVIEPSFLRFRVKFPSSEPCVLVPIQAYIVAYCSAAVALAE